MARVFKVTDDCGMVGCGIMPMFSIDEKGEYEVVFALVANGVKISALDINQEPRGIVVAELAKFKPEDLRRLLLSPVATEEIEK